MSNNKYNYLSKNVLLFTLSTFGPKVISFLMVRLYTANLTTSEYGIAEFITTTVTLAIPILTVCSDAGVLRFSIDGKNDIGKVFSSAKFMLLRGALIALVGASVAALIFKDKYDTIYFAFFFFLFFANCTYAFFTSFCRGIDKVNILVEMSFITTGMTCLFNILFLSVLHLGMNGYMVSNFLGTYLSVFWGIFRIKSYRYFRIKNIDKPLIKEITKYSFPLIFNQIGWWLNNSVDKYIVIFFLGTESNGIYSVSYKIPTILSTFSGVFMNAWALSAIKEYDPEDKDGFISNTYCLINDALCIICSALLLFNIPIAKVLYANDFFEAWRFTGPLMIAVIFGAFSGFVGGIFSAVKDTKVYSISTVLGGIVNIAVSAILVNFIGIMGVALGTLIANIVIWGFRFLKSRKYIKLRIPHVKHAIMYALLFGQFVIGYFLEFSVVSVVLQAAILLGLIIVNRQSAVKMFNYGKGYVLKLFKRKK